MNPGLLQRLFAAQQEPQWGPNPLARQYGGRDDVPAPEGPPVALEQEPGNIWAQQGAPEPMPPEHFIEQEPGDLWAQQEPMQGPPAPEGPMTIDDLINLPPEPRVPEPRVPDNMYVLDRIEDEGAPNHPMGVVAADEGTFDYNMGALPPGTKAGDLLPADDFGPWHGPTQVMEQLPPGLDSRTSLGLGYEGMLEPGNINLTDRPDVANADGSHSSVRSMSFGTDEGEALVPTVSEDARIMGDEEAMGQYQDTGRHLGMFDNADNADTYAEALHQQQAGTPTGPLISGAPLADMFGPPVPPSLPRMSSR